MARFQLIDFDERFDVTWPIDYEVIVHVHQPAAGPGEVAYLVGHGTGDPRSEQQERRYRRTTMNVSDYCPH